jgi:hypothetical protein
LSLRIKNRIYKPLVLSMSLVLAACGGGGSDDSGSVIPSAKTLSGTAAAGAPIIGQVTVKGALGNTKSALIEADGTYAVDVTGLTAPYRLRAEGTVGGRTYKLHSYAEESDVNGNVNITPFTDLIVANAAQQIAESFFDSSSQFELDAAELEAQETALQNKLQDVFDALGVDTAIDLLNTTFSADHSGLDAALDVIRVEVDTTTNIATITNLIDETAAPLEDNLTVTDDNDESLTVSNPDALVAAVTDTQQIAALFDDLTASFSAGLPTNNDIADYFADDFIQEDTSKAQFLTEITTDPALIGLSFNGLAVEDLDSDAGTAKVIFYVAFNGVTDPDPETWLARKDPTLGWQMLGDQRIAEVYFNFHCNDFDATDGVADCGINTRIFDNDFTNNGTVNDAPIASGTVRVIDGTDGTIKGVVYLGTPADEAGDVQVYDEEFQGFSGDYKGFGTTLGRIDPSIFKAGDTIEYKLYVEALDTSSVTAPQIAAGALPVATYTDSVLFEPDVVGKYPTATDAAKAAISAFELGSSLTLSWNLVEGTRSDEVLVEVSDNQGNRIEIWTEVFGSGENSLTIASSEIDATAASAAGLDPAATEYNLLVRIYAADEITGQEHSTDYRATIPGPGSSGGGGTSTGLTCGYESGYDDLADGGLGAPITPNSFADYEQVVTDCGALQFTTGQVAGAYAGDGETYTFNDSAGAGTAGDPKTGNFADLDLSVDFQWYVEAATCAGCTHSYLVIETDPTIDADLGALGNLSIRETHALITTDGTNFNFASYYEASNFGDLVRNTGADGEIYYQSLVAQ